MSVAAPRPLTGRKVLIIALLSFGTIIGANLSLVYFAITSHPGTEIKNTYVASQTFDVERDAQQALGWTASATVSGGTLELVIETEGGVLAEIETLDVTLGLATTDAFDEKLALTFLNGAYRAPVAVHAGNWQVRIEATALDGTVFKQRVTLNVTD